MDETTIAPDATAWRSEGFADQRLCVVPRPQVREALVAPVTRRLTVTDAGYYPVAAGHRHSRPRGAEETIAILCVAGAGEVVLDGERLRVESGCVSWIAQGVPHEYFASDDAPWTIWWLHARGTDATDLARAAVEGSSPVVRLRSLDRAVALFDELVGLLEARPSPSRLSAASGVAWHLLTRLAADGALPEEGSAVERAMRYLEARVDGSISVAELAALVSLSPSHLTALFRRTTGGGPAAFHTALKMARARDLLDRTSAPIGEVAAAVGYADALYFSRHFRRVHGVSPSEYRAQHKG